MTTTALLWRAACLASWMGMACVVCPPAAHCEGLRVAVWQMGNLSEEIRESPQSLVLERATTLHNLGPDVILLVGLKDGELCTRVVEALKPANYTLAVCPSIDSPGIELLTNATALQELGRTYETRVSRAQADLTGTQRKLAERQSALAPFAQELLARGALDWPEVPGEKLGEYSKLTTELDKLRTQERELTRRGYKDAHPLVQTVRTLLRDYSTQRAELERDFPLLRYLGNSADLSTNTAAQDALSKLAEIRRLKEQATIAGNALSNLDFEASQVKSRLAETEHLRLELQHSRAAGEGVAILTRSKVEEIGSETWRGENGNTTNGVLAFAEVRTGQARVSVIAATWTQPVQPKAAIGRILEKAGFLSGRHGQAETCVVGFCGPDGVERDWPGLMEQAGFRDALRDIPPEQRLTPSSPMFGLFTGPVGYAFRPQVLRSPGAEDYIAVCAVELDGRKTVPALPATVQPSKAGPKPGLPSQHTVSLVTIGEALFGLSGLVGFALWRRKRFGKMRRMVRPAALPAPSAYTVLLAPKEAIDIADAPKKSNPTGPNQLVHVETPITTQTQSASWQRRALVAEQEAQRAQALLRQGLLPELSRWLKQKLVRKLITDREELLSAQQMAARQVASVDERLARIESQIQLQTRAYIRRIEELTAELKAAKAENRELIRARIAQVKSEMEAARERLLKEEAETGGE